jgi:hypothetical protein
MLRGRQYSFQKLIQFSQGNNVQDIPADTRVSPIHLKGIFHKVNVAPTWKCWQIGSILFTSQLSCQREIMHKTLLLLTQMELLQEIREFLHFSWINYFAESECFSHLKMLTGSVHFQANSFLIGKTFIRNTASHIHCIFPEVHVILQLSWTGVFCTKWMIVPHENTES